VLLAWYVALNAANVWALTFLPPPAMPPPPPPPEEPEYIIEDDFEAGEGGSNVEVMVKMPVRYHAVF
jgi:hypothetical protein